MLTRTLFSQLHRGTVASALAAAFLCVAGCASIDILAPGANSTNISPVATDVFWNSDAQPGTIQVSLDGTNNITSQFAMPSSAANNHATANLNLSPGSHTLAVSGTFWDGWNKKYATQSSSSTFQVSSGPGRPVTYTMKVFGWTPGWPAGSLGNISFGGQDPAAPNRNVNLIFTFEGNTNDVVPFTAPCGDPNCYDHSISPGIGFEIVAGEASILIQDATSGATIAHATFLPVAKIFVSVDNGNGGIGFGSLGAVPSDPAFPDHGIEVAYPYAQFNAAFTDLKSNYTRNADWALSCTGFNGSPGQADSHGCNVPPSLDTTAGLLTITSNDFQDPAPGQTVSAVFTTVVH